MSKHPVDDLFASRLRDHTVRPERASWEELQRRMNTQEKRKSPFVGWYAAAASVSVVLLAAWWLWSNEESGISGKSESPVAHHSSKKPGPIKVKTIEPPTGETIKTPETAIAYKKPGVTFKTGSNRKSPLPVLNNSASAQGTGKEESSPVMPGFADDLPKPRTLVADVQSKEPERTLVVQVVTPDIRIANSPMVSQPEVEAVTESDDEEQPKKKRFRLGRVLRQFNKLKAGERVEWEEVGVQPGGLMARASEKVQEGKEKLTDSYENLRYNAFRKNSNNK